MRRRSPGKRPSLTTTLRYMLAGVVTSILVGFAPGCSSDDDTSGPQIRRPQDFLPSQVGDMARDGSASSATDTNGLQLIVNGGFFVYTNHGFREIVQQMYAGTVGQTGTSVRVWIFDMGSAANAEASQDDILDNETGWEALTEDFGDDRYRRTLLLTYEIMFRRDPYLVELLIDTTSEEGKRVLGLFAEHIDGEILR